MGEGEPRKRTVNSQNRKINSKYIQNIIAWKIEITG